MEQSICIFGASSTQGFYDLEGGGWCDRLKTYLFQKTTLGDDYFETFNLGISGNTTRDLLSRFDIETQARSPTLIIISIGDNDSALGVPLEEFEKNINQLIDKSLSLKAKVVLLGCKYVNEKLTNPVAWRKDCFYKNDVIAKYDSILNKVSKYRKIRYLDMLKLLKNDDLEDGLHPNPKGHAKIFEKVKSYLEKEKLI